MNNKEKEVSDLLNRVNPEIDIKKITLEFGDHYLIFDEEDALKWLKAADNAAAFAMVNGIDYFKNIDYDKAYKRK